VTHHAQQGLSQALQRGIALFGFNRCKLLQHIRIAEQSRNAPGRCQARIARQQHRNSELDHQPGPSSEVTVP
jgi:hypothetical protein